MGANDDREMLEVAKEEVGRLEAEVAELRSDLKAAEGTLGALAHALPQIVAERDMFLAQRDASRAVNADLLAAANRAALAAQSDFFTAQPMNSDTGRDE